MFDGILNTPLLIFESLLKSLQESFQVHTATLPSVHIRRFCGPRRHIDVSYMF